MGWWAEPKREIIFNYSMASMVLFKINFEWLKVIKLWHSKHKIKIKNVIIIAKV